MSKTKGIRIIMKKPIYYISIFFISIAILISGCSLETKKKNLEEEKAIPINVEKAVFKTFERNERFVSAIKPKDEITIIPKIAGKVKRIYVSQGQYVEADQLLIQLDDTDLTYSLLQAEAAYQGALHNLNQANESKESGIFRAEKQLELARNAFNDTEENYSKAKDLYGKGKMSESQFQQVETAYLQAKSNLEVADDALAKAHSDSSIKALESQVEQAKIRMNQARNALEEAKIKSPINGQISTINVNEGDIALPQSPITQVVNQNKALVQLNVNELSLNIFNKGTEVIVYVPAINEKFIGTVMSISPIASKQTLTYPVEIEIDNKDKRLKSGMLVEVFVLISDGQKWITIPTQAVLGTGDNTYVFVVIDNKVEKRKIKVKDMTSDETTIASGIKENELIVTKGQHGLVDGNLIEIILEEGKNQ